MKMPGLISYLLLVGLALAGAFPTITETEDLTPSVDDFDLVNYESDLFPELVDENTSDFEIADGVYESVEGDVGVGSFKFIPGGVKLLSEGSGLPEHEAEEQRWYDEFGGGLSEAETPAVDEHGRALPGREEDYTERTDRTNDEPASYGDIATPRAGVEEDGREFPAQKNEEQAWYGDIATLKTRMAEAERSSVEDGREFPALKKEEQAWYGDIVTLKTRIAEAERASAA